VPGATVDSAGRQFPSRPRRREWRERGAELQRAGDEQQHTQRGQKATDDERGEPEPVRPPETDQRRKQDRSDQKALEDRPPRAASSELRQLRGSSADRVCDLASLGGAAPTAIGSEPRPAPENYSVDKSAFGGIYRPPTERFGAE